jgi:hypothetical protein
MNIALENVIVSHYFEGLGPDVHPLNALNTLSEVSLALKNY